MRPPTRDEERRDGMATYEGVFVEYDRRGNATPDTMAAIAAQLQQKSILNPDDFREGVMTKWDPMADLHEMERAKTGSEERLAAIRHQKAQATTTPTTIAAIMGWGDDHVPAEMTAAPIRPVKPVTQPTGGETPFAPSPETERPLNADVSIEFDESCDDEDEWRDLHEVALEELTARLDEKIAALDVCSPRAMTLEMLVTMARDEWYARRLEKDPDVDRATLALPRGEFARKNIVVNFVKHELVFPRYDDVVAMINEYSLRVYDQDLERCYAKWRRAVIDRVSEAFPVLAEAANAQRLRRYDQRTGQLVALGG